MCLSRMNCVLDKLVFRGTRIVVPKALRGEVLGLAHEGHQGIVKMKACSRFGGQRLTQTQSRCVSLVMAAKS